MQPQTLTKFLTTPSSTGVASISSAGTVTLNSSSLGVNRRLQFWGSSLSNVTYTVTGTAGSGWPTGEQVIGSTSNGGVVQSTQDFITVTSVVVSGTLNSTTTYVGTSSQAGTHWFAVDNTRVPTNLGFQITPSASSIVASIELTADYPAFNSVTGLWGGQNTTAGPQPIISTACSSVTTATMGLVNIPVSAWRLTITSTSSAAQVTATVLQAG